MKPATRILLPRIGWAIIGVVLILAGVRAFANLPAPQVRPVPEWEPQPAYSTPGEARFFGFGTVLAGTLCLYFALGGTFRFTRSDRN